MEEAKVANDYKETVSPGHSHTHEPIAAAKACTGPANAQARPNHNVERRGRHEGPPLSEEFLVTDSFWER